MRHTRGCDVVARGFRTAFEEQRVGGSRHAFWRPARTTNPWQDARQGKESQGGLGGGRRAAADDVPCHQRTSASSCASPAPRTLPAPGSVGGGNHDASVSTFLRTAAGAEGIMELLGARHHGKPAAHRVHADADLHGSAPRDGHERRAGVVLARCQALILLLHSLQHGHGKVEHSDRVVGLGGLVVAANRQIPIAHRIHCTGRVMTTAQPDTVCQYWHGREMRHEAGSENANRRLIGWR